MKKAFAIFIISLISLVGFNANAAETSSSPEQYIEDLSIAENSLNPRLQYGGAFLESYNKAKYNGLLMIIYLIIHITALIAALIHNFFYKRHQKNAPSYIYGYFVSYYLFQCFLIPVINAIEPGVSGFFLLAIFLFWVVVGWIPGYFCIKRKFPAFVIGSITSLNPLIWIISLIYGFLCYKNFNGFRSPTPLLSPISPEPQFILHDGEKQYEPMTKSQIRDNFQNHLINENFFYWDEKSQEWRKVVEIIS